MTLGGKTLKNLYLSDGELLEKFHQGDQSSLEELINRYKKKLYTYIFLIVRNKDLTEDIFQETFLKVIKSLLNNQYSENGRFCAWLFRIAHNLIIDHYRRKNKYEALNKDDYDYDIIDIINHSKYDQYENKINENYLKKNLRNLINQLPYEQKEIIILRIYLGLTFKEIAELTNVSINTALGRMRYAILNLRKLIKEKNIPLQA